MPKKNPHGGKKHKRAKNIQENNHVDIPGEDQYFAKVTKLLGSGRVNVDYYIPQLDLKTQSINWCIKQAIGIIRGKMIKRVYINLDDIILITPRDFDKTKVDVIEKYNSSQINFLKNKVAFPKINIIQEDDEICFISRRRNKTEKTENISYQNIYDELGNNSDSDSDNDTSKKLNNYGKDNYEVAGDDGDDGEDHGEDHGEVNIDNI